MQSGRPLESTVDVEHDRVTGFGSGGGKRADYVAVRIDFELLFAVLSLKLLVVLRLDPALTYLGTHGVPDQRIGFDLGVGGVTEVAQHIRGKGARIWVGPLCHRLDAHSGIGSLMQDVVLSFVLQFPEPKMSLSPPVILSLLDEARVLAAQCPEPGYCPDCR